MTGRRLVAGLLSGVLAGGLLAGCGDTGGASSYEEPFRLPVGETRWDTTQPSWFHDGVLHLGRRTVELGDGVDQYRLGATGVYWMRRGTLMFTDIDGATEKVAEVGWGNLAVSADRSVFATVDQSHGPEDKYGTRVIQVAAFDTRTGEQLYRTPDQEPDAGADLADLYGEIMPLLHGVGDGRLFFDGATIALADGSQTASTRDEGLEVYEGYAETLFPDGYHVSLRGQGRQRTLIEPSMYAVGRLSPDRSLIFDVGMWPTPAVVYEAETGRQRPIQAPWDHFTLVGWTDRDTFFGVAERIDEKNIDSVLRERQVVTCEVATLDCAPVSPVIPTRPILGDESPYFLVEGDAPQP